MSKKDKSWGAFKTVGSAEPPAPPTPAAMVFGYAVSLIIIMVVSVFVGFVLVAIGLGRFMFYMPGLRWIAPLMVPISVVSGIVFWARSVREEIRTRREMERKGKRAIYTYQIRSRAGEDEDEDADA